MSSMRYAPISAVNNEDDEVPMKREESFREEGELIVSWEPPEAEAEAEAAVKVTPDTDPPFFISDDSSQVDNSHALVHPMDELITGPTVAYDLHVNINNTYSQQSPEHERISPVRRYSAADLTTAEAVLIASDVFAEWDKAGKGFITVSEIVLPKLDPKFISAIGRVLAFDSPLIYVDHLTECISVLKYGDLPSKVKLLLQFMDDDGNHSVSFSEIQSYLKASEHGILEKLGIAPDAGKDSINYDDLLYIFQASDRGNEAIDVFCQQILGLITNNSHHHHHETRLNRTFSKHFSRRNSTSGSSAHDLHFDYQISCFELYVLPLFQLNLSEKINRYWTKFKKMSHVEHYKIALVVLQIAFWLINFFYYRSHGYPLAFCIAKGFGLNLRILSIFIYATMARTTMGQLYAIAFLRPLIPLGINIEVHSFIGYSISMHMFGHTFGHIAYQTLYTSGFQNAFTQNSLLRGDNWEAKMRGDGKTGFLLLAFVLLMGATALYRSFSASNYRLFNIIHYFYLLYLPMLFLHVPNLWPYFVAIGGLMILERAYDFYQKTYYTTLANSRPCHNGVTFLSVPRHGKMTYPGSYYRIKIPSLSVNEWHPFSLAGSTSSHHLTFFIASAGDWTRELHKLVSDPAKRQTTLVQVQGPFLAPASQALVRKPGAKILCVASGIGITPFFSVMATKVTNEVSFENDRLLFKALFQEVGFNSSKQSKKHQPGTLMHALREAKKQKKALMAASASTKEPNRAVDNENLADQAIQINSKTPSSSSIIDNNSNRIRPDDNAERISDIEEGLGGTIELGHKKSSDSFDLMGSNSNIFQGIENILKEATEESAVVKVVWSIRDFKELAFYLEYVHHLVKSQEQLNQSHHVQESPVNVLMSPRRTLLDEELGQGRRMRKRSGDFLHPANPNNTMNGAKGNPLPVPAAATPKRRNAVEVEVFLTGLGNSTDPVYMLSQTLFLLSIANKSSSYMKITFGRPDLKKLVETFNPEEVYYCGGSALKDNLQKICHDSHIPFHPEDFDSGGGEAAKTIQKYVNAVTKPFASLFCSATAPVSGTNSGDRKGTKAKASEGGGGHHHKR